MSGGASKRVRLEMSLEDQLTAHKQRLQYLREIEAEQSSEWRDMNASEAARLAAKRSTPDATPEWIQEGQASSAGFYAGLKDRAVENGGVSGFGLYYGAHIGGLLADTGYHLTRSGYGVYQLLTDSQARSDAWNNLSYALTHPGEVVSGLQQGLNSWLAKPFGQQADDLFQLGTTALAGGVVGKLKVPGENTLSIKRLLPTEGNVGTYDELIAAGSKGDNITPHHIPSANIMAQNGVGKGDGIAINMEQPYPGVGGRHRKTFTYGTTADLNMSPREALAAGVWDARRIYQQDGLYGTQIRSSLQDLIKQNKNTFPDIFRKY